MNVRLFTDGACSGNPGRGGWCAILTCNGSEKVIYDAEDNTTNNRMEMLAVINGLSALKTPCSVEVITDSKYVCDAFNAGWLENWKRNGWRTAGRNPVKNDELWRTLDSLTKRHSVSFHWIKGHAGHAYNERCDVIASSLARGITLSEV